MQNNRLRQLFSNIQNALLAFSHTPANYWGEFFLDIPLGIVLLYQGLLHPETERLIVFLMIVGGIFAFSFFEYMIHRWVFHGSIRIMAEGHYAHHRNPLGYDALPFFLPALLILVLLGLFSLVMPFNYAKLLSGGVAFGYVAYGLGHYLIHHNQFQHPLFQRWAQNHLSHHYRADKNFGVTTPLWDYLLKTHYVKGAD